jgi:hypothetical protein
MRRAGRWQVISRDRKASAHATVLLVKGFA